MALKGREIAREFKVDFMILGAQKCGTTSLANILKTHENCVCCTKKEPYFFSHNENWKKNVASYKKCFPRKSGAKYFEASTSYTRRPLYNDNIWDDLYEYNPNLRFLYVVRPPLERIVSAYVHSFERGFTDLPIEEAIFKFAPLLPTTRYYVQIAPFIEKFGKSRVKILFLSALKKQQSSTKTEIAKFLDIDPQKYQDGEIKANSMETAGRLHHKWDNPGLAFKIFRRAAPKLYARITDNSSRRFAEKPQLSTKIKKEVLGLLENDIKQFEQLTNQSLAHWRNLV